VERRKDFFIDGVLNTGFRNELCKPSVCLELLVLFLAHAIIENQSHPR